ncbi:hypothetical protein Fmac_005664 [Flemingia macrophylla]|uniref:Uncharacterized protein n=1 Tax=Flemingia macrophylla TaxID=520843 RepID=A0ABD1N8E0_9FABA
MAQPVTPHYGRSQNRYGHSQEYYNRIEFSLLGYFFSFIQHKLPRDFLALGSNGNFHGHPAIPSNWRCLFNGDCLHHEFP